MILTFVYLRDPDDLSGPPIGLLAAFSYADTAMVGELFCAATVTASFCRPGDHFFKWKAREICEGRHAGGPRSLTLDMRDEDAPRIIQEWLEDTFPRMFSFRFRVSLARAQRKVTLKLKGQMAATPVGQYDWADHADSLCKALKSHEGIAYLGGRLQILRTAFLEGCARVIAVPVAPPRAWPAADSPSLTTPDPGVHGGSTP